MPKYFFSLMGDEPALIDVDGMNLADIEAARMSAVFEAREIMKAGLFEGCLPLHLRFEVTDTAGKPLLTIPFDKAVRICWPRDEDRPQPSQVSRAAAEGRVEAGHGGLPVWLAACGGAVAGLGTQMVEPSAAWLATPPAPAWEFALAAAVASLAWLRTNLLRY